MLLPMEERRAGAFSMAIYEKDNVQTKIPDRHAIFCGLTPERKNSMKRKSILWLAASSGIISMIADIYWGGALSYYYMRNLGLDIKYHIVVWIAFQMENAIHTTMWYLISRPRLRM